jgi:hypothetical protein
MVVDADGIREEIVDVGGQVRHSRLVISLSALEEAAGELLPSWKWHGCT